MVRRRLRHHRDLTPADNPECPGIAALPPQPSPDRNSDSTHLPALSMTERMPMVGLPRCSAEPIQRAPKTHQLRALFMALDIGVQLQENTIEITLRKSSDNEPTTLSVPARLVRRGNEVRVTLAPNGSSATSTPDPTLIRLMAQAFAARDHLLSGKDAPLIVKYDQRHQQRLARLSWLAPDIVSAILDGTQPIQLTARHLIRCATVPLEWQQQRKFLGFA